MIYYPYPERISIYENRDLTQNNTILDRGDAYVRAVWLYKE